MHIGLLISVPLLAAATFAITSQDPEKPNTDDQFVAKIETYRMVAGTYPSEQQGLDALVEKPSSAPEPRRWKQQFKTLPKDPWGQEYEYKNPGTKDPSTFEVLSKGEDMELGTDDDLSSQELQ